MVQGESSAVSDRVNKEGGKVGARGSRHGEDGEFNKINLENKHKGR